MQETQLWIYTRCSYNACAGSAANGYFHLKYTPSTIPVQETCTIIIVDLHRCSTMPAQALQQTGIIIKHTHQVQYLCKKLAHNNYGSCISYTRCSYNACAGSAANGYSPIVYTPSTIPVQETQLWIYTRCSYNACAGSAANGYLHLTYTPSNTCARNSHIIIMDRASPTLGVVTMPAQALQ